MKIAGNISVVLGEEEIILHPSLRCAMNLANRVGGLRVLVRDLLDQSITAAIDCLEPHCDLSRELLADLIVSSDLQFIQFVMMDYVTALMAIDPDATPSKAPKATQHGEQQSYDEFYLQLYKWGTGWLGWTPKQTLDSTPFEIIEAHVGRMDMLKSIFGGGERASKDDRPLDEKFRSVFATLGTQKAA